ncbi:MAG TPA: ADP-ribosylglycohydrolase family protein [Phycisphaerales bacterium]|nr:ADP-ribosylglycohydrolase family protein [Phycisphaerales bacterium]
MNNKVKGSLYGLYIGDALAMPVHWYYDRAALNRDYGWVDSYLAPKNPHPNSILWRSHYQPVNEKGEILHHQARYWGERDVHYHQFLKPGENTVNLKLCQLSWKLLQEGYSKEEYINRYIAFMRCPSSHNDTYLEEYHRGFFTNYARGKDPLKCAVEEKHIGGLCHLFPVYLSTRNTAMALEHMACTHAGRKMKQTGTEVLDVLEVCLQRGDVIDKVRQYLGKRRMSWLTLPDEEVIGMRISTVCYVEESWPAVLYLLAKYLEQPARALEVNTNLGGDNCYRGAVLGALLGAFHGEDAWPLAWRHGLVGVDI